MGVYGTRGPMLHGFGRVLLGGVGGGRTAAESPGEWSTREHRTRVACGIPHSRCQSRRAAPALE
jgi:hypothetical protein